jgi:hypothetical protein
VSNYPAEKNFKIPQSESTKGFDGICTGIWIEFEAVCGFVSDC